MLTSVSSHANPDPAVGRLGHGMIPGTVVAGLSGYQLFAGVGRLFRWVMLICGLGTTAEEFLRANGTSREK
ncbi:hypothetical protein BRC68_09190 [Halobacteriales archaeon QH_6_64_20]|nr:MAG: hypothetical protein BRC68_09190 [Halobacteriales archaeon QH_6_64_20]